jgi:hypothetical protein
MYFLVLLTGVLCNMKLLIVFRPPRTIHIDVTPDIQVQSRIEQMVFKTGLHVAAWRRWKATKVLPL